MEYDTSGKMRVVETGNLQLPATCISCGAATHDEGFLDAGIFVDYFGQIYFCLDCAREIVKAAGGSTPVEDQVRENLLADVNIKAAALAVENKRLTDELRALRGAIQYIPNNVVDNPSGDDSPDQEEPLVSDQPSLFGSDEINESESIDAESIESERSDNVKHTEPSNVRGNPELIL